MEVDEAGELFHRKCDGVVKFVAEFGVTVEVNRIITKFKQSCENAFVIKIRNTVIYFKILLTPFGICMVASVDFLKQNVLDGIVIEEEK